MIAFLFTIALFLYWGVIGHAVLAVFPPRLRIIQSALIAPVVGVATTLLPVFFLNRTGLPVKDFAPHLFSALGVLAVLVLAITRPLFPALRLRPYAILLMGALLLVAWPMLLYGFDWVSYANDDMANYCLGAQRFLNHGFLDAPDMSMLREGREYSLTYWFMHVAGHMRSGSELTLAAIWGATGLNAHQLFMPVIMALHLALICSTTALITVRGIQTKTSLLAMLLMAVSPLTSLGAIYQLIGQVGGLGLLCAAIVLTYRPCPYKTTLQLLVRNIPAALVLGVLFVWYPEALPFFGLGWIVYFIMALRQNKATALKIAVPALVIGGVVLLIFRENVFYALLLMLAQGKEASVSVDVSTALFPYFLVPSGIANLWGLLSIVEHPSAFPALLYILGGIALSYWFVCKVLPRQAKQGTPVALIATIIIIVGLVFFFRNSDFGLFKLAMYFQPFLCCVAAIGLSPKISRKATYGLFALWSVLALITQFAYVEKSTGEMGEGSFVEVPHGSAKKINQQFGKLFSSIPVTPDQIFISDTSNVVIAKFQALYTRGSIVLFPANRYMNFETWARAADPSSDVAHIAEQSNNDKYDDQYEKKKIGDNTFLALKPALYVGKNPILISTQEETDIFNRYHARPAENAHYFFAQHTMSNLLQFCHSTQGPHYYSYGDKKKIAFYQLESDPMFPGQNFSALGRHILFRVFDPLPHSRIEMELTDTVVKQFNSELPHPLVQNTPVNFVGRGTGRVFSSPLEFTYIDNTPYVSFDMGRDGALFPEHKSWLMLLYGRDIPTDRRRIATFGRDISLVTDAEYQALTPPSSLEHFPADLANKNLEYSGIYEDGWISERSFFMLTKKDSSKFMVIKGMVPAVISPDFHSTLDVQIDGKSIIKQPLSPGNFEVKVPVQGENGKHRIDLSFDRYQVLRGNDLRPTGGHINFIGYTDG